MRSKASILSLIIISLIVLLIIGIGLTIFWPHTPLDAEKFSNIASGIQSLVLAGGVIVGAIWTLYTFNALGVVSRALAERTEIERRSREEPVLELELEVAVTAASGSSGRLITIATTFRNDGKRIVHIHFDQFSTLLISRLVVDENDVSVKGKLIKRTPNLLREDGTLGEVQGRLLRTGQSRKIPFAAVVPSPGLYFIQVTAIYTGVEMEDGRAVESSDVPIMAYTQMITEVV